MIEDIKNKYPETWEVLISVIKKERVPKPLCRSFLGFKYESPYKKVYVKVTPNTKEFSTLVDEYVDNIKEPVWSLCELLATRGYHNFHNNMKDNFIITIDGVEFVFGYDGWSPAHKLLSPRIDKNDYEYKLLNETFYDVVLWETRGRIRQELKDKLCGGEIDDK